MMNRQQKGINAFWRVQLPHQPSRFIAIKQLIGYL
jgi:hypothetical protein